MSELTGHIDQLAHESGRSFSSVVGPYEEREGKIFLNQSQDSQVPLCNFTAKISFEEIHDDGAGAKIFFVIDGKSSDGRSFHQALVPSDKYAGMTWVNASWGTRAIVYAGPAKKDHLRVAIQMLSRDVSQRTVYTHLGWRRLGGQWAYLHSGGAITQVGTDTSVHVLPEDDRLKSFNLPPRPPEEEMKRAVRASLLLIEMAPKRVTVPLLAAVYRAPLGEAHGIDCALFLTGASGSKKSECSAIAQAHFGKTFNRLNLPGNWASSDNSLERQAFLAKDAIFTVDDFAPTGTASDVARLNKKADRLIRGQGNKAGRGRLSSDAKGRPEYYPRGLTVLQVRMFQGT